MGRQWLTQSFFDSSCIISFLLYPISLDDMGVHKGTPLILLTNKTTQLTIFKVVVTPPGFATDVRF